MHMQNMAFKVLHNTETSHFSFTQRVEITPTAWGSPCVKILKIVRTIVPIKFLLHILKLPRNNVTLNRQKYYLISLLHPLSDFSPLAVLCL